MEVQEIKEQLKEIFRTVINNDKWITIHPHGEDSDDYRRIKLEDGETPKEAIERTYGKKDNISKDYKENTSHYGKKEHQEEIISLYEGLKNPNKSEARKKEDRELLEHHLKELSKYSDTSGIHLSDEETKRENKIKQIKKELNKKQSDKEEKNKYLKKGDLETDKVYKLGNLYVKPFVDDDGDLAFYDRTGAWGEGSVPQKFLKSDLKNLERVEKYDKLTDKELKFLSEKGDFKQKEPKQSDTKDGKEETKKEYNKKSQDMQKELDKKYQEMNKKWQNGEVDYSEVKKFNEWYENAKKQIKEQFDKEETEHIADLRKDMSDEEKEFYGNPDTKDGGDKAKKEYPSRHAEILYKDLPELREKLHKAKYERAKNKEKGADVSLYDKRIKEYEDKEQQLKDEMAELRDNRRSQKERYTSLIEEQKQSDTKDGGEYSEDFKKLADETVELERNYLENPSSELAKQINKNRNKLLSNKKYAKLVYDKNIAKPDTEDKQETNFEKYAFNKENFQKAIKQSDIKSIEKSIKDLRTRFDWAFGTDKKQQVIKDLDELYDTLSQASTNEISEDEFENLVSQISEVDKYISDIMTKDYTNEDKSTKAKYLGVKKSKINNSKEQEMALLEEIKKLITRVENNKENEMEIENAKVDKRDIIRQIMAIAGKEEASEDVKTIAKLAEKLAYDKSEAGTADNEMDKEDPDDEKEVKEVKEEVKEDVENKCKNSVDNSKTDYFAEMNKIYNAAQKAKKENIYISQAQREQDAVDYFKK